MGMPPKRLKPDTALYTGTAQQLRAKIWYEGRSERIDRHRNEWPDLWELIDRLVELTNRDFPSPMASQGQRLFD